MGNLSTRAIAVLILEQVIHGRSLDTALQDVQKHPLSHPDKAFIHTLCYGVLRFYYRLQCIVTELSHKPLASQKDKKIALLAMLGIYQLLYLETPPHAAVSETVSVSRELRSDWAAAWLNAILRNFCRQQNHLLQKIDEQNPSGRYAHPAWMVELTQKDWPAEWPLILEANNQNPSMFLRVNRQKISREQYLARLTKASIEAQPIDYLKEALLLKTPLSTDKLPGFEHGLVSVQDGGAQFVPDCLELKPHMKILDACAAPGGKTAHLLETEPTLNILALEVQKKRIPGFEHYLKRLQLHVPIECKDATKVDTWWDEEPFDRILLDAPCSGVGVIRRHPDIKLLRQYKDIESMALKQKLLLESLWPTLKPKGRLLYVTCSFAKLENHEQIKQFVENHSDAKVIPLHMPLSVSGKYGNQILPGQGQMDGFFYACLQKN